MVVVAGDTPHCLSFNSKGLSSYGCSSRAFISAIPFMQCTRQTDNCTIAVLNKQLNVQRDSEMATLSLSVSESSCETNCSLLVWSISCKDDRNCSPNT